MRPNFLDLQKFQARREGATLGAIAGCVIGIGIMVGIHLGLSMHSDSIHERAMASIKQADALLLNECKQIVQDVAEENYDTVVAYKRQIEDLRVRR